MAIQATFHCDRCGQEAVAQWDTAYYNLPPLWMNYGIIPIDPLFNSEFTGGIVAARQSFTKVMILCPDCAEWFSRNGVDWLRTALPLSRDKAAI